MSRPKNPLIAERNANIIRDATDPEQPLSDKRLEEKYGVSIYLIRGILRHAKIKRAKVRPKDPRRLDEMRPISKLHQQIGIRIDNHRVFEARTDLNSMGIQLRLSGQKLRAAELGSYDFTLSQLQSIAQLLGITLEQLVKEKDLVHAT